MQRLLFLTKDQLPLHVMAQQQASRAGGEVSPYSLKAQVVTQTTDNLWLEALVSGTGILCIYQM